MEISKQLLELKALTSTLCSNVNTNLTNTKLLVLYFCDEYTSCSPQILISKLGINKSNLALVTKQMKKENLISSKNASLDKRQIAYSITPFGKQVLTEYLDSLNKSLGQTEQLDIKQSLYTILDFLNKKI